MPLRAVFRSWLIIRARLMELKVCKDQSRVAGNAKSRDRIVITASYLNYLPTCFPTYL